MVAYNIPAPTSFIEALALGKAVDNYLDLNITVNFSITAGRGHPSRCYAYQIYEGKMMDGGMAERY